jgi:hypothetical protein
MVQSANLNQEHSSPTMQGSPAITRRRYDRFFYVGMTVAMLVTVFAGFARTYYLRPYFVSQPLMPLLHLHGLVFSTWVVLFVAQTSLVAARKVHLHRRLGIAGAVLAAVMVVLGVVTAVIRASQGATPVGDVSAQSFLIIPLGDMLIFGMLVAAAFYFRRKPDTHKRLMLLATISILSAAIARLPFAIMQAGPPAFFALTDIFLVVCIAYDLITLKRIHRATMWGALLIVVSQPLRLMLGGTRPWLAFANWLISLAS